MSRASRGLCELTPWKAAIGTLGETDIDVSEAVYTGFIVLLTIANPSKSTFIDDCWVHFDLDKDTTGFGAVNTTETITLAAARKVDGTNIRVECNTQADGCTLALTGTLAAAGPSSMSVHVGPIGPDEDAYVYVKLSAETGGDCEIPYVVYYRGRKPTITEVAAA